MKILSIFILVALVAYQVCARDDDTSRALPRIPQRRGPITRGKPTPAPTVPAPQDEEEYIDENDYQEQQEPSTEAAPSSTEGKKIVAITTRPSRSHTDLLEALKRRRALEAEGKKNKTSPPKEVSSEESIVPKQSTKGRFSSRPAARSVQPDPEDDASSPAPAPLKKSRAFSRRGN